jgi:plastocyanin
LVCLPLIACAALGCGNSDDASPVNANGGSAGNGGSGGVPAGGSAGSGGSAGDDAGASDSATPEDTGPAPLALNGCTPAAFVEAAMPTIFIARDGLVYTPKCLTVDPGTTVRFEGSLAAHPLAPGNPDDPQAGSPANPIQQTASGSSVEFTFTAPGTYAYHCVLHSFGAGSGMAGAIFVR